MSSLTKISRTSSNKARFKYLGVERLMAIFALTNFLLVLFDISYIPWRDYYFQITHQDRHIITDLYDPIKGIEPHRQTEKYLGSVEELKKQVSAVGITDKETEKYLENLRDLSTNMIETNPFAIAEKTGTLERIKNRMREHMQNESAKQAFDIFWSPSNLGDGRWPSEIEFYDKRIKPLIQLNYFRRPSETIGFVEDFWKIDLWFIIPLALEFLLRTWIISRRYTGVSWLDAMLWRWYDVFLLLPFWRFLRIIPVTIRLSQAKLIDLRAVKRQFSQGLVATIAKDVTQVVVIEVITQFQDSIRSGEISKMISQTASQNYIDINNVNETAEIVKVIVKMIVTEILPQIKPDLEALLQYSVAKALNNSSAYKGMAKLPGLDNLQKNLTEQLSKQILQLFVDALNNLIIEDPKFNQLIERLTNNTVNTITTEIKAKKSVEKIEYLLSDMLEEIKINYVERLSEEDVEELLEKTRKLREKVKTLPTTKA